VTDGKKNKFSTKVAPGELLKFQAHYGSLLKASMTTLRKRDKKREKIRSEGAAKRRKSMTEPIVLDGSKRGKGRRKHQRKLKALLKQQESQKKHQEREEAKKKSLEVVVQ
jgi:signal recognition particle subunit SRP14